MFNLEGILKKKKLTNQKIAKKYTNIKEILNEYLLNLKNSIPNFDNEELINKLEKNNISFEIFNKYLNNTLYISNFLNIKKKYNLSNNDVLNLIRSNDINIYLDYDDVMVDLVSVWLVEYNKLVTYWINNNLKINFKDKKELVKEFVKFFSNKSIKHYQNMGYNIYGKNLNEPLIKISNSNEFENIINKIEPVFIDKLWEAYKYRKKFNIKKEDIKYYYIFSSFPLSLNFLEKGNIYMDDNYEINMIEPYNDSIKLYNFLVENNLINKTFILTASYPGTEYSKFKHVEKNFPLLSNRIITTKLKEEVIKEGILYDDSLYNNLNSVNKNNIAYTVLRTQFHNMELGTGKRIYRIKNSNEFIELLPLLHLQIFDRIMQPEIRKEELLNNISKDLKNNCYL